MRFIRRGMRGGAAALLLLTCTLASLPAAANDDVARLRHRQQRVAAQHDRLTREIRRANEAQTGLLAKIGRLDALRTRSEAKVRSLDGRIRVLDGRIRSARRRLQASVRRLRQVTDRLQSILRKLDARTRIFTERAIASYKAGPTAGMEALLSSESFGELVNRYAYYELAITTDSELIQEIRALRQATESRRAEVARREEAIRATKDQLQEDRRTLAQERAKRRSALATLRTSIAQKHAAVGRIENQQARLREAIAENARESAEIASLLQAGGGSGAHGSGQLLWPVAGPITSGFGWRVHPIFHTREFHPGIDIGAPYGASVGAADAGVVEFAGRMTGYGNVLVIDHGGGLATLYGHLSAYSVSAGQSVARGAPIASVGCTGWCTGPHLHFEVRLSGRPVDPIPYLK